jgi:DNA segregation ATPase FtsK/SpoIIIE-like protein
MEVDEEHQIRLLDYSHWAILGSTGSGKSYLAQLLLIQFVRKCFDVRIYDVKKSYAAFSDIVETYETEPERIIRNLKEVAEEMRERQNNLADIMKTDPRALAVQYGYRPIVVFIEEYIGLKTLLDKEQTKTLENTVKEISVLARSVNISLFIVAQSSSVDIIDSAIKNNLNKIFLGHLASNISVSTFGTGVEVPLFSQIEKGYGYIQLDKVEQIKVPNVLYSVDELKQLIK